MLKSISFQLIFVFIIISLIGMAITAFVVQQTRNETQRGQHFANYREKFITVVKCYYDVEGSLENIEDIFPSGESNDFSKKCNAKEMLKDPPAIHLKLVDLNNNVKAQIGGPPPDENRTTTPEAPIVQKDKIQDDAGNQIATIISSSPPPRAEWGFALGAVGIILIIGPILIHTIITHPIRKLTAATQAIAAGDLDQQVTITSKNELGELATAFNQMSTDLARSNQLRRQMTADIAHELRNPLTVLTMDVEGLHDGILKPTASVLNRMQDEVQNLNRLVGDLRTLSLADANELRLHQEPTAPQALLDKLALLFEFQARNKGITLTINSEPNLPDLDIDPERITQVFINLVSNALRYTPEGGRITLAAKQTDQAIQFSVVDDGAGIAPDQLPHIFERFYRADSAREQDQGESGLGLAIVKSLVEAHGGTVSVESEAGQGTKFVIVLPQNSA